MKSLLCLYLWYYVVPKLWLTFQGTGPSGQPVSGPTNLDNPTHPILPKRVMYYQASFDKTTTVSQVGNGGKISCYIFAKCVYQCLVVFVAL